MENTVLIRMIKDKEAARALIESQLGPLVEQKKALDIEINVLQEVLNKSNNKKGRTSSGRETRDRALQKHWIKTLQFIGHRKTATLEDINFYLNSILEMGLDEATQRSKMASYANKGWLDRVSPGVFVLTESGAAKCGFIGQEKAPDVGALSESGIPVPLKYSGATQTDDATVDDIV